MMQLLACDREEENMYKEDSCRLLVQMRFHGNAKE